MGEKEDATYLRAREDEEREAAARSSCMVKDVHLEMADEYHSRADAAEQGQADPAPGDN